MRRRRRVSIVKPGTEEPAIRRTFPSTRAFPSACAAIAGATLLVPCPARAQQTDSGLLPDAPSPQMQSAAPAAVSGVFPRGVPVPCLLLAALEPQTTFPPAATSTPRPPARRDLSSAERAGNFPATQPVCNVEQCTPAQALMSCGPDMNPFLETVHAELHPPRTPREKAVLAARDVLDPFNLLTITGTSAISIASNADTAYGPGVMGWAKLTGVTLTEDMTGEFFGTFLIPSIAHQDPHYHRMPNAPLKRRIEHCIYQVVWSQADDGRGIFNYATVLGTAASEGVNNLYVPYRQRNFGAAGERYWTALATDPIGNFITEFVPDLARRLNVRIVLVQRIVNRVAIEEGGG